MKKKFLIIGIIFVLGLSIVLNSTHPANYLVSDDGEHEWNGVIEPVDSI